MSKSNGSCVAKAYRVVLSSRQEVASLFEDIVYREEHYQHTMPYCFKLHCLARELAVFLKTLHHTS